MHITYININTYSNIVDMKIIKIIGGHYNLKVPNSTI